MTLENDKKNTPDNKKPVTKAQTKWVLTYRLAQPFFAFLILIFIGQKSSYLMGQYALAMTYYFVLILLPLLGLNQYVAREVARKPSIAGSVFITMSALCTLNCIFLIGLAEVLLNVFHCEPILAQTIRIVSYAILPAILCFLSEIIMTSLLNAKPIALIALLENALRFLITSYVLYSNGDIFDIMYVLLSTRCLGVAAYAFALNKTISDSIFQWPSFSILNDIRKVIPVFFSGSLLQIGMNRLGILVISYYVTTEEIGYYAIAYRPLEFFMMGFGAIVVAFFPRLSKQFIERRLKFLQSVRMLFISSFLITILISLLGYLYAESYIKILFSNQFPFPVPFTKTLIFMIILMSLDCLMQHVLIASDLQNKDLKAMVISLSAYTACLFLIVPQYGINGAIFSLILATGIQLALRIHFFQKQFSGKVITNKKLSALFVIFFSFLTLLQFTSTSGNLPLLIFSTLFVLVGYPLVAYLSNVWEPLTWLRAQESKNPARPDNTVPGLIDRLSHDAKRHHQWKRAIHQTNPHSLKTSPGFLALMIYRFSRYFYGTKLSFLNRFFFHLNVILTKAEIVIQDAQIDPGMHLSQSIGITLVGKYGRDVTVRGHCGIGLIGKIDVGAGPGLPIIEEGLTVPQRILILGGQRITSNEQMIPHSALLTKKPKK